MEIEPYDVRRLLLLRDVAVSGSLSEAARQRNFTTSAVSQQIAKLEREVGVPLLDRVARGVHLTDAGVALVGYASAIDRTMAAARSEMEEFAGLRRGSLRLGTFPTVAAALMPTFVTEFQQSYPDIRLEIRSARFEALSEMLARREIELATLWEYPWLRIPADGVEVVPVLTDPTMLVVSEGHPLARRRTVALADLAGEPWVTRASHPVADVLHRICVEAGFEPSVSFAASDYTELQAMVAAGIGVAIAPRLAVLEPRKGVRVIALRGNPAPRRIVVAWAQGRQPSPAMRAGVASLRSSARAVGLRVSAPRGRTSSPS